MFRSLLAAAADLPSASDLILLLALTASFGVGAQVLGRLLQVPSIVFLLLFGLLLGPSALGLIDPSYLGEEGLEALISLAVAVILFEGGLTLDLSCLGELSRSLRNLVTLGTAITLLGGSLAARYLAGLSWHLAFLYATLIVVTGPTTISPLLERVRVDRPLAALLEGEGVFIDPIGAFLAILAFNAIVEMPSPATLAGNFGTRVAIGVVLGASVGWGLAWALERAEFLGNELKNLVVLAAIWLLFASSQALLAETGLLAAVVAGIASSRLEGAEQRSLERFQGQLAVLSVSVVFILLAANLAWESLLSLGWGSLLTVLILMFVVRPLSVWICTWGSTFSWQQKVFASWAAPKGIVSASVASLFAIYLDARGIPGGERVEALVFLTIIATVFLQGLSAQWVANRLQIVPAAAPDAAAPSCQDFGAEAEAPTRE